MNPINRRTAIGALLLFSLFAFTTCKPLLPIIEKSVLLPEYQLTVQTDGNGLASPEGTHTVKKDVQFSVSATALDGYFFDEWSVESGTGVSFENRQAASTKVALSEGDATIQANFVLFSYDLTITNDGNGLTNPTGMVSVGHGVQTSIVATPNGAYSFSEWSIVDQDTGAEVEFGDEYQASTWVSLTDGGATIRANFTLNNYTLTVTNDGNGTTLPTGTKTVAHGAHEPIQAFPNTNYGFKEWQVTQGSDVSFGNITSSNTWVMLSGGNATIKANFARIPDAAFQGSPTTGNIPFTVDFTDASTGEITTWAWDFDNNGTTDSDLQNPSHEYTSKGIYSVKLTVSGPGGSDSSTRTNYITANGVPSAPSSVTATVESGSQIDLTWTDNASDEANFEVWRNLDGGSYVELTHSLPANTTSYSDNSIVEPGAYRYRVKAVNQAGSSSWAYSPTRTTYWLLKTPDSNGDVGISPSLMIFLSYNTPRISYYDATNKDLKMAYEAQDGTWFVAVIDQDSSSDIGRGSSFAITSDWEMRISYKKDISLQFAYFDPVTYWQKQTVDSSTYIGTPTSMVLYGSSLTNARVIAMDYDPLPADVRLYTYNGSTRNWSNSATGVGSADITQTSLGVNASGLPRFCYYQSGDLKYAWYTTVWNYETIEGTIANWEKTCSLAVDGSGYSHVAYLDTDSHKVMYAKKNSANAASTWSKQMAYDYSYSGTASGGKVALCLDSNGKPHIACTVGGQVIYTSKTGSTWVSEVVDSTTTFPNTPAIAMDGTGRIHIAYDCSAHDVKYARKE
jgi:PKD repeat protein